MKALRLQILGRVQGVWFRESMRHEAERLGVTGWVCNSDDGSVNAMVQGSNEAVDTLLAARIIDNGNEERRCRGGRGRLS